MADGLEVPDGMDQRYRDSFQQMLKMARALYDAGIPIVAGTVIPIIMRSVLVFPAPFGPNKPYTPSICHSRFAPV